MRLNRGVRAQLLQLDRLDGTLRSRWVASGFKDRELERDLEALCAAGIEWLREVIAEHGWPGHGLVGRRAADAASRLIQHAECPLAFQRRCLRLTEEAARRGEVPARHVAYLTDVVRLRAGRKQVFGTKFREVDGALVPYPIEKASEVDARRRQAELEPLAAYARRLRRRFFPPTSEARRSGGLDWDAFVRQHWERGPVRLSAGEPLAPPAEVFRTVVAACEPFRQGTRFRALPNVKFLCGEAQLRAPGPLLPGAEDTGPKGYVRRVAAQVGRKQFQLLVEQPFLLDFPLWARLRDFVRQLLERVGYPVLPLSSEVIVGDFARSPEGVTRRPHHALFLLVLEGRLRVRVWKRRVDAQRHLAGSTTLEARAGDVLHVPSHMWHLEECRGPCMAVRVWLPVEGSRPADAVQDVLTTLLSQQLPIASDVPYLPFPGRRRRGGTRALVPSSVPSLVRTARQLEALTRGPDLSQALRIIWAQRVSACGLEPVPPPEDFPPLEDAMRVRAPPGSRVVRMQVSPGQWIWAIHGHVFPMAASPESLQVLETLAAGEPVRVDALCRLARRAPRRAELRRLLETLQSLRALEVVTEGKV